MGPSSAPGSEAGTPASPEPPCWLLSDSTARPQLVMLLWQPAVISLLATLRQSAAAQGDALVTSEAGLAATPAGWTRCRDVCPPPATSSHTPSISSPAHGDFSPRTTRESPSSKQPGVHTTHSEVRSPLGKGKGFLRLAKRAPVSRSIGPHKGDSARSLALCIRPRVQLREQHNTNDYLPEPHKLCAVWLTHPQSLVVPGWSSRG